ncbi:hypothetical protein BBP40_005094 [Aspergillus hancockii]|nr:hypothetical protein BBP40_005094 [Aspergillus hancockii]
MTTHSSNRQSWTAASNNNEDDLAWEHLEDVSEEHAPAEHSVRTQSLSANKSEKSIEKEPHLSHIETVGVKFADFPLPEKSSSLPRMHLPTIRIIPPSPSDEILEEASLIISAESVKTKVIALGTSFQPKVSTT